MSNMVVIISTKEKLNVTVLGKLHKLLGGSLVGLRSAIMKGNPIVEMELFDGEYDQKASLLRALIALIRDNGVETEVYELSSGQTFTFASSRERQESLISLDVLENILKCSDEELDRQLNV